jgi:hypothetical protein
MRAGLGEKNIEDFKVGDWILSAPENEPDGHVEARRVEELFTSYARLWHLRASGEVIRTTAEHPFYVRGLGWVPARRLAAGDLLRSHDGQWIRVEDIRDSGIDCPVYNLRVEKDHTYFVGGTGWGFSVWAHNACSQAGAAAAAARHGGLQIAALNFKFTTRRDALMAASEIAGNLGPGARPIRLSEFRGGPWWTKSSKRVIGRQSADGTVGWRDDFLGHSRLGAGSHVNVWGPGGLNFHLFY